MWAPATSGIFCAMSVPAFSAGASRRTRARRRRRPRDPRARCSSAALRVLAHVHAERPGQLVEVRAIEERVRQSVDEPQRHVVAGGGERLVEQDALMVRHGVVREAVHDEKRRRACRDVRHRTRRAHLVGHGLNRRAHQPRLRRRRRVMRSRCATPARRTGCAPGRAAPPRAAPSTTTPPRMGGAWASAGACGCSVAFSCSVCASIGRERRRPVGVEHALHGARLVRLSSPSNVPRGASAATAARCPPADVPQRPMRSGIETVGIGVGPEPADGRLHVLGVGGEGDGRRQPVLDRRHREAVLREEPLEVRSGRPRAAAPAAAVEKHDDRQPSAAPSAAGTDRAPDPDRRATRR